ncbi:MAG TPA: MBL fold metallo-hydrolase [Actinomycetales bacterium]
MRLTVVGCSGSLPGPGSAASCYLIEADDVEHDGSPRTWRVLLDLGSGALGPLQQHVDPATLDAVLLTHLHPDHCLDLCGLYVLLRYGPQQRPTRLPVWGPRRVAERMERAYDALRPGPAVGPQLATRLDLAELHDRVPVTVGPLLITPVRVNHPVPAFGFRVEHAGRVLAYTGDTDSTPALAELCAGADLVLADSAYVEGRDTTRGIHLSGRRAAEAVVAAGGVGRLVLTHMPPWNDPAVCLAQARDVWDGPLEAARAGSTYEV